MPRAEAITEMGRSDVPPTRGTPSMRPLVRALVRAE
jgi:hypothetical protein